MEKKRIVFVYNARSGRIHAWLDTLHKIFSPSTYACRLCAITYGYTKMNDEWKRFIDSLETETEFLHTDEFEKKYPEIKTGYPVAYILANDVPQVFITVEEMLEMDLNKLMETVRLRLKPF